MNKHYTIPFFILHKGCPFTCIFCRQDKISGKNKCSLPEDIAPTIREYLKTIPRQNARVEIGFFGGSFTGLDGELQKEYLEKTRPFIKQKKIHGVRLSTRPDYINQPSLDMLKKYWVTCIELGVQSASNRVLKKIKRGHSLNDIQKASKLILSNNISLGHQIMTGLPGSTLKDELNTAKLSIDMGAGEVRIYPVLVIKGTELAEMWKKGLYKPLSESTAIRRCALLIELFERNHVKVIRCGLHPSEGLLSGKEILDGPFHPAFRQKVETYIYKKMFKHFFELEKDITSIKKIYYNPLDASYVLGYKRTNADYVEKILNRKNLFEQKNKLKKGTIQILFENNKIKTITKYGFSSTGNS
ncbi:MAG: radical SAM protein [Candidatus Omnitrophota bacterium]